jgi:hypothetical protein
VLRRLAEILSKTFRQEVDHLQRVAISSIAAFSSSFMVSIRLSVVAGCGMICDSHVGWLGQLVVRAVRLFAARGRSASSLLVPPFLVDECRCTCFQMFTCVS